MGRIITVTSGKGGVGKTNISVSLGLQLAGLGHRACLFDADLGLANVNIILGLYPEHTLEDVIANGKSINDILIRKYDGLDIIPGSSGVEKMADLEFDQLKPLLGQFSEFDRYEFLLFDTSAGISRSVISFCMASSEVVLVITPEPTSLTDAYGLLKTLCLNGFKGPAMIVVNESKDAKTANLAYAKLKNTVDKHLPIKIVPLGLVLHDDHVPEALKEQTPFILRYPDAMASKCIKSIAKRLVEKEAEDSKECSLESFWANFIEYSRVPVRLPSSKGDGGSKGSEHGVTQTREGQPAKPAGKSTGSTQAVDSVAVSEQERFPEIRGIERMVMDNHDLLTKLSETVSFLVKEIGTIREVVEAGNGSDFQAGMSSEKAHSGQVVTGAATTAQEPRTAAPGTGKQATDEPEPGEGRDGLQSQVQQSPTHVSSNNIAKAPATVRPPSWLAVRTWKEEDYVTERKDDRLELVCPVTVEGIQGAATIRDVSLGGAFLEIDSRTKHQLKVGQKLAMAIKLPSEDEPISVKAEVANVRDQGIGCKFLTMGPKGQGAIQECIDIFKDTLPIA
jgi:flagellar biosynthesis protein FlhG